MPEGTLTDTNRKGSPMGQRPLIEAQGGSRSTLAAAEIALDSKVAKRTQTEIPTMTGMRSRSTPDAMSPITTDRDNVAMLPPALPRVAPVSPLAPVEKPVASKPIVNGPSKA